MQYGFYFDQSRCTGCYACTVACKDWHDIPDSAVQWRMVHTREEGTYPDIRLSHIALSCCHCEKPACREACPVGAISKRQQDGIMVVDREACLGKDACARFCLEACPYDVPQFDRNEDAKMQMCTFCIDRLAENKNPVCVDACPMRALDWGPLDELQEKYGTTKSVAGFDYSAETKPSLIVKPRYGV